ncbi:MAG: DUF1801 domain-containing protein [Polyangiaceae bacterium]|nr:DUF1801 domain-containing protein [Polyangiaceae bacterium]
MASAEFGTAEAYLASLPADRRDALAAVRNVILKNLPKGYEEGIEFGMIAYSIPLSRFPKTYNGRPLMLAAIASQKSHMAVYLTSIYGSDALRAWFERAYRDSGKKLDMGKSCVRFKQLDELALDVVGEAITRVSVDDYLAQYEAVKRPTKKK